MFKPLITVLIISIVSLVIMAYTMHSVLAEYAQLTIALGG